jgi:hypothetical protein
MEFLPSIFQGLGSSPCLKAGDSTATILLIELICGLVQQATEDVLEVRERVNVVVLAGAGQGGRGPPPSGRKTGFV